MPVDRSGYDAILLTGGSARRLGGQDKPKLDVGGVPIVARVAKAVTGAHRLIVVGPAPDGFVPDVLTREEPAGGGPVAAMAAGITHVSADFVAVLAGDLPFLTAQAVDRLHAAVAALDVALLVDDDGRDQLLCAVWRTGVLRSVLAGRSGGSVRALFAAVPPERIERVAAPRSADPPPWFDCDTEEDLASARHWTTREKTTREKGSA
jgi:molybdopterin-guanine dinucleotide biosynthesis protein A